MSPRQINSTARHQVLSPWQIVTETWDESEFHDGCTVSEFCLQRIQSKEKLFVGGGGGGARVSDFFTKTLNRKKILGEGGTEGLEKVIFLQSIQI